MRVKIQHLAGSKKGQIEEITAARITLGRNPDNVIAFDPVQDADCSGNHAALEERPDGFVYVVDLKSSNGTFVNGVPVPPGPPGVVAPSGSMVQLCKQGPALKLEYTPGAGAKKPVVAPTTAMAAHPQAAAPASGGGGGSGPSTGLIVGIVAGALLLVGLIILIVVLASGSKHEPPPDPPPAAHGTPVATPAQSPSSDAGMGGGGAPVAASVAPSAAPADPGAVDLPMDAPATAAPAPAVAGRSGPLDTQGLPQGAIARLVSFKGATKPVTAVVVSKKGERFAAGFDGELTIGILEPGKMRSQSHLVDGGPVIALEDNDFNLLVVQPAKLAEWRLGASGQVAPASESKVPLPAASLPRRPIGAGNLERGLAAFACVDGSIAICKFAQEDAPRYVIPKERHAKVSGMAFSPDGSLFTSVGLDASLFTGRTETIESNAYEVMSKKAGIAEGFAIAYSGDGSAVAYVDEKQIRVMSPTKIDKDKSGNPAIRLHGTIDHTGREVHAVALSHDAKLVAFEGPDHAIEVHALSTEATGKPVVRLQTTFTGHTRRITSLAFSGQGTRLLASGSEDGHAILWKVP